MNNAAILGSPEALRATARAPRSRPKGRAVDADALAQVQMLMGPAPKDGHPRDRLIEHLHRINDHFNGLPEVHLVALAQAMRLSVAEVFEVASFYHHFEILRDGATAPGLTVRVCDGLSCQLAGAVPLLADVQSRLSALLGRDDVRVIPAPCVGRCEQAPAVQVGQWPLGAATTEGVAALAAEAPARFDDTIWALPAAAQACVASDPVDFAAYRAQGGYALAASVASGQRSGESVLAALEHAGLRGLGGAGFPAGRKWRIVKQHSALPTGQAQSPEGDCSAWGRPGGRSTGPLMAVNIDEGEPGTFKDRWTLERDPHRLLEGVLIAASVVGCEAVYLYLRDEYHHARRLLQRALADLLANPPCALPLIELRRGAGAYICGEESAMIESIEGKRGEPRLRPPYIAEKGLFGRPTLQHNAETLLWVREIVERGGDWFAAQGRHGRQGLRRFSVSGRVKQPGVKLAPAGITVRELIDEFCGGMADGHTLYAYLPGGASGGILPARLADVPLDFDTLQPHGCFIGSAAVVVLGQRDSAREAALNQMRFFAHESCGQCTPCRAGTDKAARLMDTTRWDVDTLQDLASVMGDASICGLGQAAPNPLRCVIEFFPHEIGLPSLEIAP
ncbi:MAG: NADH:ubiquinone oxidoreductase subunit F (NADH-binding)/NADH:ubiquinone oxidoreductase subunit E [Hydrogenophaga sp.]